MLANRSDIKFFNWMSVNFLTHTTSKTEFLIIRLHQQLSLLSSPTICLQNKATLSRAIGHVVGVNGVNGALEMTIMNYEL